jgi:hypothetical protein
MLGDAVSYARSGDEVLKRLLIGGAVQLGAAVFVVPGVFLYGYLLRVVRDAVNGRTGGLPAWDDWGELGMDGLKAALVVFAYTIPAVVVAVVIPILGVFVLPFGTAAGGGVGGAGAGASTGVSLFLLVFVFGILLATVLVLFAYYLLPAALVGLATRGELGAAFRWSALRRLALSKTYFVGMVIVALVALIGGLVATPLILLLVGFVLQFLVLVVVAHVAGQTVAKAA